jgi:hypothetical protein
MTPVRGARPAEETSVTTESRRSAVNAEFASLAGILDLANVIIHDVDGKSSTRRRAASAFTAGAERKPSDAPSRSC